jgi:NAD-dependent deacetylase
MNPNLLEKAVDRIKNASRVVAFSGAGISVESGIPPFRGPDGLWSRYDPTCLEIQYFLNHPAQAWVVIKEIFYDFFSQASPNAAHFALAKMEAAGRLQSVITQNIDNLHQRAGSQNVIEFHGTSSRLICIDCGSNYSPSPDLFNSMPPRCKNCRGMLKPDFVFFGEPIPWDAMQRSLEETTHADLWLVIGTTGEVQPACMLPREAKGNGATIIEVNVEPSQFTPDITDVFLQGKAAQVLPELVGRLCVTV